jgi:hypothetical protein
MGLAQLRRLAKPRVPDHFSDAHFFLGDIQRHPMKGFLACALPAALFLISITACNKETPIQETREDPQYSFTAFLESINTFPYEAPKAKQDKIRSEFPKLSLGMEKKEVEEILGKPDAEFITYDLQKGKEELIQYSLAYYLYRHEKKLVSDKIDRTVFLYFDANAKLYWAVPTNVESLVQAGGPSHASDWSRR